MGDVFVLREIEGVIGILQGLDASNVCTYAFVKKKFVEWRLAHWGFYCQSVFPVAVRNASVDI